MAVHPDETLGLYVHVPYCSHRCPYCDFYLVVGRPDAAFVDALLHEWEQHAPLRSGLRSLASIYLGGGTPGLLEPAHLERLLRTFTRTVPLDPGAEVTLEVNPMDVTPEKVAGWLSAGVTRVSVGTQSIDAGTLRVLGRDHDGRAALHALERLAATTLHVSADLILATPGQPLSSADADVDAVAPLVGHVSAYCLTYEPGTHLDRQRQKGRVTPLTSDDEADRYERVRARLKQHGFTQYEISSHARAGRQAVHNRRYWSGRSTLGLGPSAVSYLRQPGGTARRWRVAPDLPAYLRREIQYVEREQYSPREALIDRAFSGLRDMERGINLSALEEEHGLAAPPHIERALLLEEGQGTVERVAPRHFRLTPAGALFADRVAGGVLD